MLKTQRLNWIGVSYKPRFRGYRCYLVDKFCKTTLSIISADLSWLKYSQLLHKIVKKNLNGLLVKYAPFVLRIKLKAIKGKKNLNHWNFSELSCFFFIKKNWRFVRFLELPTFSNSCESTHEILLRWKLINLKIFINCGIGTSLIIIFYVLKSS